MSLPIDDLYKFTNVVDLPVPAVAYILKFYCQPTYYYGVQSYNDCIDRQ